MCGHYETLRIVFESLQKLKSYMENEGHDRTVEAAVRNNLLSYQPSYEQGQLVRALEQPWAQAMRLRGESHRIPMSWLGGRYGWLYPDGGVN